MTSLLTPIMLGAVLALLDVAGLHWSVRRGLRPGRYLLGVALRTLVLLGSLLLVASAPLRLLTALASLVAMRPIAVRLLAPKEVPHARDPG